MSEVNNKKNHSQTFDQNREKPPIEKDKKILIIGLGQIGYSNAEYIGKLGLRVDGYDINEKAVQRALAAGVIHSRAVNFRNYDYYIICISTHDPSNMFVPYLDGLFEIAQRLADQGTKGSLVGIDSTITKGTSRKMMEILKHRLHVAHVPHRFYMNDQVEHGVRQMRVVGGCDTCCLNEAVHFYKDVLDIPLHAVNPIEIAELTTIVENSQRFMEIAFAEELKMVCDTSDIEFEELRKAVNTKWNAKILEAKGGIGGHCLPKDTQMFLDFAKNFVPQSLLDTAKMIDSRYKTYIRQLQSEPLDTGDRNDNVQFPVHIPVKSVSTSKDNFGIADVDMHSLVFALINKMAKENPKELINILRDKK